MIRTLPVAAMIALASLVQGQTYFYIDAIAVQPTAPTEQDAIAIDLIGGLSSTSSSVTSASASVNGFVVTVTIAADGGGIGLPVIVGHTETVPVGELPAGDYEVIINGQGVADLAPTPQHFFTVDGGSPCDDLGILSVQWHPFTDTALVVHVQNTGGTLFDYPNFILLNTQGDTLAQETVDLFGIGPDSWHLLRIMDGVTMPAVPFDAMLDLWTNVTTSLACSWEIAVDLCPPAPCTVIHPSIQNTGGQLVTGTFDWTLLDDDGEVASGLFTLTTDQQWDSATECLPPGNYHMDVIPQQPPFPGAPLYYSVESGVLSGPSLPVSWNLPVLLPFSWYLPCADIGTGLQGSRAASSIRFTSSPGSLIIHGTSGDPLGHVTIHDALGRSLFSRQVAGDRIEVPVTSSYAGVWVVRAAGVTERVLLTP